MAGVGVCLAAAACTDTAESTAPSPSSLRLAKTTANVLSQALARMPEVRAEVVSEGGSSITSLIELRSGKTDIAVPVADVAYLAYAGQLAEMPGTFDQLRGMAVIDITVLHLLLRRGTHARSLGDLKGLRISLGAPGSSVALITERMLQAHGIQPHEYQAERIPNPEILKSLTSGRIDAAFSMFGPPQQTVTAAMQEGARLLDIEGPIVEEMRKQYPYLRRALIPPGMYPNQPAPVRTIAADVVMVCRADLEEAVVYRLLSDYFATLPAMTPPNLDRAPATPIPLHPGAARYYRQRELSR